MKSVGPVSTYGVMGKNIRVNGSTIKCTEKGNYGGQMEKSTWASSWRINAMDKASSNGKTAESMRESGCEASNMESVYIETLKGRNAKDNG